MAALQAMAGGWEPRPPPGPATGASGRIRGGCTPLKRSRGEHSAPKDTGHSALAEALGVVFEVLEQPGPADAEDLRRLRESLGLTQVEAALTLSVNHVPVDANMVTTPRGLRLTVNDDSTQLYRVEIPFFHERVDFLELYYLIGPDGVHQLAVLQDDLSVRDVHVTAPDAPLRKGSKARKLLTA